MTSKDNTLSCIVCNSSYFKNISGVLRCHECDLLYSGQKSGFGNPIQGMNNIAMLNYDTVAKALESVISINGAKILDVGSAEGGFTELMIHKGANSLGLEPDTDAAKEALAKKIPFQLISFENFVGEENTYDAIVFNDVFEHMQDPTLVLDKSCKLLNSDGLILINAPMSSGFIFRVVKFAARFGIESPYRRIWGKGLSSPHIYFYSEKNLKILLSKYDFDLVCKGRLIALSTEGMYQRVRSTYGPLSAMIISIFASLFVFISNLFPPDVMFLLFKKNES